ncbi:MAG: PDZ domain-containing protein [Candidatus Paracaedibacteraceae bacterium]|nr:PDZ domain-containing protein [Candidatus Paracaedibacteraceae bacterium]
MHELGFTYRGGLLVSKVSSATPVKEAGLEKNDVIVSINDIAVEMVEDLRLREAVIDPKLPVEMLVWRAKKFVKLIVRPVPKPKSFGMSTVLLSGNHFLSGLQILELTPEVSEKLKLPSDTKGLVVLNGFDPQLDMGFSFSRRAALIEKGDLLLKMNGKVLSKPDDLKEVLEKKTPDDFFDLLLVRNGRQIQLTFNSKQESIMNNNKIKNNLNMQKEDSHPFISDQQGQDDFLNQFQKQVEGMLMGMRNPNTIISADSEMATNA